MTHATGLRAGRATMGLGDSSGGSHSSQGKGMGVAHTSGHRVQTMLHHPGLWMQIMLHHPRLQIFAPPNHNPSDPPPHDPGPGTRQITPCQTSSFTVSLHVYLSSIYQNQPYHFSVCLSVRLSPPSLPPHHHIPSLPPVSSPPSLIASAPLSSPPPKSQGEGNQRARAGVR